MLVAAVQRCIRRNGPGHERRAGKGSSRCVCVCGPVMGWNGESKAVAAGRLTSWRPMVCGAGGGLSLLLVSPLDVKRQQNGKGSVE